MLIQRSEILRPVPSGKLHLLKLISFEISTVQESKEKSLRKVRYSEEELRIINSSRKFICQIQVNFLHVWK